MFRNYSQQYPYKRNYTTYQNSISIDEPSKFHEKPKDSSSPNSNPNVKAPFSSTTPENLLLSTSDISLTSIVDYKRLLKIRISEKCPSLLDIVSGRDEKTQATPPHLTMEEKLDESKVMIQQATTRVYAQSLRDVERGKISYLSYQA